MIAHWYICPRSMKTTLNQFHYFNSFPNDKILDYFQLKAFADDTKICFNDDLCL